MQARRPSCATRCTSPTEGQPKHDQYVIRKLNRFGIRRVGAATGTNHGNHRRSACRGAPVYRVGGGRPMSTRRITSTAPSSSARLINGDDLPIGLIDIELSMPPAELLGDTAVVMLGPEQGPPAAVLKVARGLLRATELRTQRRVLAELAIHQGLNEEWRDVLPRILAFDERRDATVSVESYRPGMDLAEV